MDTGSLDKALQETKQAVMEAGKIIRKQWDEPRDIHYKSRTELVTKTDMEVEEFLKKRLGRILPQADFLAEETAPDKKLKDFYWIIDPLDGTTNFAHNIPLVAISVALWINDHIALGIIYLPIIEELFFALKGHGSYLNDQPIQVSTRNSIPQSFIATGFPYDIQARLDEVISPLQNILKQTRGLRRMGAAAVDLAYTACGRFDAFYEVGLKPWDTAAGWLLVTEAGGTVTQFDYKKSYKLWADGILASNGHIHSSLSKILMQS